MQKFKKYKPLNKDKFFFKIINLTQIIITINSYLKDITISSF